MKNNSLLPTFAALVAGILIGGFFTHTFFLAPTTENELHPIADPFDTEYHVHADFRIYVGDEQVDLSDEMFMTSNTQTVHKHAHLHDGNGEVKHIHAEGITFTEFLESLDITLTNSCLTISTQSPLCSDTQEEVLLYVNDQLYTDPLTQYVPVDDDRILLYFGSPANPNIETYIENIPADACFYSGTCPERGVAPPESCGLTCEL